MLVFASLIPVLCFSLSGFWEFGLLLRLVFGNWEGLFCDILFDFFLLYFILFTLIFNTPFWWFYKIVTHDEWLMEKVIFFLSQICVLFYMISWYLTSLKCEQSLLTSAPSSTAYIPVIHVLVPLTVFFEGYSLHAVFSFVWNYFGKIKAKHGFMYGYIYELVSWHTWFHVVYLRDTLEPLWCISNISQIKIIKYTSILSSTQAALKIIPFPHLGEKRRS